MGQKLPRAAGQGWATPLSTASSPSSPRVAPRAENLLKAQSSGFTGGSGGRRVTGPPQRKEGALIPCSLSLSPVEEQTIPNP